MSETVVLEVIKTIATIATLIIGGVISIRLGKLHNQINSRMDQLLSETRKSSKAEGKSEEADDERKRKEL